MIAFRTIGARVVSGSGALEVVSEELARLGMRHAFLISTPGRAHTAERIAAIAGPRLAGSFHGAVVHVPGGVVDQARAELTRVGADGLLSLGGGAATGVAKAVAVETGLPILAVPTTFSGSEVTSIWGRTDHDGKRTGRDPRAAPRTIIYDPDLTVTMPLTVSGPSGVNAVAHCLEALYAVDAGPVATLHAREGLRLLGKALRRLATTPQELRTHAKTQMGALFAGSALEMSSMGLQHTLSHVLGGLYGLPHALVHAVLLPHVVSFNAQALAAAEALKAGARALGFDDLSAGLAELNRTLGIPRTLAEIGFDRRNIKEVVETTVALQFPNPRAVTPDGVRNLLSSASGLV